MSLLYENKGRQASYAYEEPQWRTRKSWPGPHGIESFWPRKASSSIACAPSQHPVSGELWLGYREAKARRRRSWQQRTGSGQRARGSPEHLHCTSSHSWGIQSIYEYGFLLGGAIEKKYTVTESLRKNNHIIAGVSRKISSPKHSIMTSEGSACHAARFRSLLSTTEEHTRTYRYAMMMIFLGDCSNTGHCLHTTYVPSTSGCVLFCRLHSSHCMSGASGSLFCYGKQHIESNK